VKLYFLRHGLADREEWSGDDFVRPLTEKGRSRMEKEADRLAELDFAPEVILTSPLTRARQTAEIVAARLDRANDVQLDERLALGFGMRQLSEILAARANCDSILMVGHEPDFSETIGALIGGGRVVCKKGSLARVDLESLHPPRGRLVWLVTPSILAD